MKALTIGANAVRRLLRDRSNIFFVFIFPMLLIVVIGVSFGGDFKPRLGLLAESDGEFVMALVDRIEREDAITVEPVADVAALNDGVERGRLEAGLVIPAGYDAQLADGAVAQVQFLGGNTIITQQLRVMVEAAVAEENVGWVAVAALGADTSSERASVLATAAQVRPLAGDVAVDAVSSGEALLPDTLGQFDLGASQELLLFIFLASLAGSVTLVQSRKWGVTRRMTATPTSARTIVTGEALGRFLIAMVQGVFIMVGSLVVFAVNWGDPMGAIALLVVFCAVGAGAGMLVGATVDNDQQAGSFGIFAALGLAAIGGCMVPIEFFPPTMQTVAHFTPHAWGLDGFAELVRNNGTIVDILPELGVLAGFAAVLLGLASWRLRKTLTA